MATLKIHGKELLVKPLNKCRNADIIEFQRQSGMKMSDITEHTDFLAQCVVSFLTQHNAGFKVKWDDILNGTPEDIGEYVADPIDEAREGEGKEDENPSQTETPMSDLDGEGTPDSDEPTP